MKQKVVMKVSMNDQKSRSKAMKIAVGVPGVESAAIQGDDKSQIVVTGDGIDSTDLTMLLRKKFGRADLVSVGPIKEEEKKKEPEKKDAQPVIFGVPHYYSYQVPEGVPSQYYNYEARDNSHDSCTIT